ncbi:MAG: alanine dehydrogenase [Alphaproteobacteria bacterium]|jgi:ornithine cyclodeaminase/alanine dehydrogenase-like protein (mu-crystallin family)|nr:alanine dehydrogenase [Alphaproteobacteria bacterium]
MTLILSNKDVEKLLTMRECIDVLEEAYVELAEGRGVSRTRSDCLTPTSRADAHYSLKSMDGVIPKLGISAIRLSSDIVTMPKIGNNARRVKIPAAPNDRYVGLVLLFSTENGEPLAILPDGVIQRIRVGAANGLGIKYLARKDAQSVGILGSGWQAGTQLMAACAVRNIKTIRCFSPHRDRREAFAKEMSSVLNVEVIAVDQPETAMSGADIAICASNSLDAIFFEPWARPGMYLSSIKNPEIEMKAVKRADRVVIHTRDTKPLMAVSKELPESATAFEGKPEPSGEKLDITKFPTLPEVIAGQAKGRQGDDEVTCFLNNMGLGYQFAAAGSVVYRKAKELGVGHELPTDWFTEDVHP